MTTNQTIDGVPRRMLTALLCHVSELENRALVDELRALLDAEKVNNRQMGLVQFVEAHPIKPTGLSQGWNLARKHDGFVVGHQSVAYPPDQKAIERAERDGYVWVPFLVPAAQPQGEPVVLMELVENKIYGGMHIAKWDNLGGLKEGLHRLYTEQPAPVAVVPEGWQMVPATPTDDMIVAFAEAWYSTRQTIDEPDMLDAYRDMLVVAPKHPQNL